MRMLLLSLCCFSLFAVNDAHISLTFPAARTQALDFLDNARTQYPCGQPRGNGPTTDLLSGANISVTWYLGYAHEGGYRIELLTYDAKGQANVSYTLTSAAGLFVEGNNITASSARVILPPGFTCSNCTLRLVRQALNWGPKYIFWSCADVNILPVGRYVARCSGNGRYDNAVKQCVCNSTFSGNECQHKDECDRDEDCGSHGRCKRVTQYSFPQKQCFCQPGWFGLGCQKVSPLTSVQFDPMDYNHLQLSSTSQVDLYYRILGESKEIEIILRGRTQSYIGIGWKPTASRCCKSGLNSVLPDAGFYPPVAEPIPEPEPLPEGPLAEPGTPPSAEPEPGSKAPLATDCNGMDCTDMVIGAAIGKLFRIYDYYSPDRSTPRLDEFYGGRQTLTAAVGEETDDGWTTIAFRKPLASTEDTDRDIRNETMVVIWSHGQTYSDTPAVGDFYRPDELKYHGQHRGVTSLNFFGPKKAESTTGAGEWAHPPNCQSVACEYRASWSLDANTDVISFKIRAKQQTDKAWTGIAFGRGKTMENLDVIYAYQNSRGQGIVVDGWIGSAFTAPTKDPSQDLLSSSLTSDGGILTLTFTRHLASLDTKNDYSFAEECFYFVFPVGGGSVGGDGNGQIGKHFRPPLLSDSKICISRGQSGARRTIGDDRKLFLASVLAAWLTLFYTFSS